MRVAADRASSRSTSRLRPAPAVPAAGVEAPWWSKMLWISACKTGVIHPFSESGRHGREGPRKCSQAVLRGRATGRSCSAGRSVPAARASNRRVSPPGHRHKWSIHKWSNGQAAKNTSRHPHSHHRALSAPPGGLAEGTGAHQIPCLRSQAVVRPRLILPRAAGSPVQSVALHGSPASGRSLRAAFPRGPFRGACRSHRWKRGSHS